MDLVAEACKGPPLPNPLLQSRRGGKTRNSLFMKRLLSLLRVHWDMNLLGALASLSARRLGEEHAGKDASAPRRFEA